jgi:hypothetical protein
LTSTASQASTSTTSSTETSTAKFARFPSNQTRLAIEICLNFRQPNPISCLFIRRFLRLLRRPSAQKQGKTKQKFTYIKQGLAK